MQLSSCSSQSAVANLRRYIHFSVGERWHRWREETREEDTGRSSVCVSTCTPAHHQCKAGTKPRRAFLLVMMLMASDDGPGQKWSWHLPRAVHMSLPLKSKCVRVQLSPRTHFQLFHWSLATSRLIAFSINHRLALGNHCKQQSRWCQCRKSSWQWFQ